MKNPCKALVIVLAMSANAAHAADATTVNDGWGQTTHTPAPWPPTPDERAVWQAEVKAENDANLPAKLTAAEKKMVQCWKTRPSFYHQDNVPCLPLEAAVRKQSGEKEFMALFMQHLRGDSQ